MEALIELRDIHFRYPDGRTVLNGVNLKLAAGERVALCGANGSGKTTLLHVITGLCKATQGEVSVLGEQRTSEAEFQAIRGPIGILFQDSDDQLFCPTVAEEIAFGPLNLGKSRTEVESIVDRVMEETGLTAYRDRIAYRLSGGEKRLVALASVLAMDPQVLLLDEPVTGLDETTRERITTILKQRNAAMLVVSHDKSFRDEICGRSVTMQDGRIQA